VQAFDEIEDAQKKLHWRRKSRGSSARTPSLLMANCSGATTGWWMPSAGIAKGASRWAVDHAAALQEPHKKLGVFQGLGSGLELCILA